MKALVMSDPVSLPVPQPVAFRNIGLIGRPGKDAVNHTLDIIHQFLLAQGLNVLLDEETAHFADSSSLQVLSRRQMGETCDLVIVVGGDGSLLHAGRALARHHTPVLGVNRGRLGFLTDVSPQDVLEKLSAVLAGQYTLDRRFLLHVEIRRNNVPIYEEMALNDVVLHSGKAVHMIEFELEIDGHLVYHQHSDGLIIATPTGSTAYSLSGGGPIVFPGMDAIVLTPMHPHTLSSRPIVISGHSEIRIRIPHSVRVLPMVSPDGQSSISLEQDDVLLVRKHPFKLTLLHPPGYNFYAACRDKLGWNQEMIER